MRSPGSNGREPISAVTSIGVVIGGAYAAGITVLGLWEVAGSTFPYLFGIDVRSDSPYPFPYPVGAFLGTFVACLGLALASVFVRVAMGSVTARWYAIGGLVLVACGALLVANSVGEERRCAVQSYSGQEHCVTASTAALRDFILLALPAALAIGCLGLSLARRRPRQNL